MCRSDKQIAGLIDGLPDALFVIANKRVIQANSAASELLGATHGEIIERHVDDILCSTVLHRVLAKIDDDGSQTSFPCSIRFTLRRLDNGESVPVDCRIARLQTDAKPLRGAVSLLIWEARNLDRAERLIASLASLSSNDAGLSGIDGLIDAAAPMFTSLGWWAGLLRTSPAGVEVQHLLSPPIDGDQAIVSFAVRVKEMGVIPWEMYPLVHQVYETGEPIFLDDMSSLMVSGGFGPEFMAHLSTAGFTRGAWVPVRSGGITTHVLLVVGPNLTEHDLAAMQLVAAKLGAARRLEELQEELVRRERLAAIGEMAAVLAHEVRNPLAVIFNAVAGLRRTTQKSERDSLLGMIHEEADRLKRVVRDLVDFARPSVPEIQPVSLRAVLNEALEAAKSESARGDVSTGVDLSIDLPSVEADPHLLRRALVNVLDNAYQSASEHGGVSIWAGPDDSEWVRLRIRNSGRPDSKEQIEKAFLPFFTTRATGTGLGLTVVNRIIEDLGGKVTLDMDENGVSVLIRLRISRPGADEQKERV